MIKNSTARLLNILREDTGSVDKVICKELSKDQIGPKEETINIITGYARSVKGVKIKSGDCVLVSLN